MNKNLCILILEDHAADAELMEQELREGGVEFTSRVTPNRHEFLAALKESPPDVVLADYAVPGFDGLEALKLLREQCPDAPFICVSGIIGEEIAVELIKQGATDFVPKEKLQKLPQTLERALRESEQQRERRHAEVLLRDSESRFRAVFEAAGAGIALEDLDGRIVETNHALQQMLGYSVAELQHIKRPDFTHSHDNKEEQIQFERLLAGKSAHYQAEKRFVRRDGRLIWGRLTVSMVRDASRKPQFALVLIEDITERQQAEEAYIRYAGIVESSTDAIISMTFDGIVFSWNPAAERLYGYSAQEANGRPVSVILPPDKEQEFLQSLGRIRQGETIDNFETTRLRKDGLVIQVSVTASPIKDLTGRVAGVSTISRDITERKHAEAALRKSEENYRRLVELSPDGIIIVDHQGRIVLVNSQTERIFGYRRDELLGREVEMLVPKRGRAQHPAHREGFAQAPRVREMGAGLELFGLRKDGIEFPVEISLSPLETAEGLVTMSVVRDITERKKAAEALRKSEAENQKLAAFVQFNPNPVLELAANGAVNYSNEAARQMAVSLGKQQLSEVLPAQITAIVKDCLVTDQSRLRHDTVINQRTISWSFFPVQAIGVVHCYASDITERQILEAQLRQSQKMESIGQLAGGVAHDFNNILTVIQGHTSLLSMTTELSEDGLDSARQISLAAERAANLTRQLLTFSRRQVLQPKNLDLTEVVGNMTKMLRRLLGEDITLQVNYAPSLPLIHADPGMMEQILLNLSVNARDAMPKGGRLYITTSVITLDEVQAHQIAGAAPGEYVCLSVKDTGSGIPPEHLPHIFEPFFTTKDVGKGTGLGLATVYGIVQQHHGWIKVESKLQEETIFQVFLPAVAASGAAGDAAGPQPKIRGGTEMILLVEDEAPLRMLVRNVLERYGYQVLEASSGVDALPIWLEHKDRIHLLLTDMVMPHGVSGRELAERLRGDKPDLKVIYSSGYSLAVVGTDMVLQEGLNFLQKPYNPRKLAQAIRDCLDG